MERRIVADIPIEEIVFDESLYPRVKYNWQTGYDYAISMKAGAKFPLVTLAVLNDKKVIVDGKHRIEANKILKMKTIKAEVFVGWNKQKIFEEAIKRNITHGRALSPYEKRVIALKLREMNYKPSDISQLIQVSMDKLENFVAQRLVNSITGETIKEVIIKGEIKHLAGRNYSPEETVGIKQSQASMYSNSQLSLINDLISLIENDLINLENEKITTSLKRLAELLSQKI